MQYLHLLNDINKCFIVEELFAFWPYEPYIFRSEKWRIPHEHPLPQWYNVLKYLLKHWGQHCPSLNVGWSHFTGGQSSFLQSTVPFWNKQSWSFLHMLYLTWIRFTDKIQFNLIIAVPYKLVKLPKHSGLLNFLFV